MLKRDLRAVRFALAWDELTVPEKDIVVYLLMHNYVFEGNVHKLCNATGVDDKKQNANYRKALFRLEDKGYVYLLYGKAPKYSMINGVILYSDWTEIMSGSYLD